MRRAIGEMWMIDGVGMNEGFRMACLMCFGG